MEQVGEDFPRVEFLGLDAGKTRLDKAKRRVYQKFLNEEYRRGLTIVGNSRVMETRKEEKDTVSFLAKLEDESN